MQVDVDVDVEGGGGGGGVRESRACCTDENYPCVVPGGERS